MAPSSFTPKFSLNPPNSFTILHSIHPTHSNLLLPPSSSVSVRISTTFHDFQQASSTLVRVLSSCGYSLPTLLKIKRNIWHNYQPSSQSINPPKELIPIITFFDKHHSLINQACKSILKSNPIFQHTRTLSAFCKHRTFLNHLIRGRYTSHNSMPF